MDPVQGVIEGAILIGVVKIAIDVNKIAGAVKGGNEPKGGPSIATHTVEDPPPPADK